MQTIQAISLLLLASTSLCLAADDHKNINLLDLKYNPSVGHSDTSGVEVRESQVYINNILYRQIEYKGRFFYLKASSPTEDVVANNDECIRRPEGQAPSRIKFVYGQSEEKKRNAFFIESLEVKCGEQIGWQEFISKLKKVKIGVSIPGKSTDKIKDKRIYVEPTSSSLNFQGSF